MQLEDKLVDGRDVAQEELRQRDELAQRGDEELPEVETEAVRDPTREQTSELLGLIRMILNREALGTALLVLPLREREALEALQVAVSGRSRDLGQFVYATDRRDMLERALAVLQPDLSRTDDATARELHGQLADMTERVGELRAELLELEDSQDELLDGQQKEALEQASAPTEPKPAGQPTAKPGKPEAAAKPAKDAAKPAKADQAAAKAKPAAPAAGEPAAPVFDPSAPDLPEERPQPTTLTGPDLPAAPPPPTTLIGADLPEERPQPTTLVGPDLPAAPPPPTTLTGADLPDEPSPPSTLDGDGPEPAAADPAGAPAGPGDQKKSWWRRPFG